MTIDLTKAPQGIPAIWLLALALIAMNEIADDHIVPLAHHLGRTPSQTEALTARLIERGYLIRKPGRSYIRQTYTLTPEGHRLLDRIEAGCPIG